jgi:hypothetical protein
MLEEKVVNEYKQYANGMVLQSRFDFIYTSIAEGERDKFTFLARIKRERKFQIFLVYQGDRGKYFSHTYRDRFTFFARMGSERESFIFLVYSRRGGDYFIRREPLQPLKCNNYTVPHDIKHLAPPP